MTRNIEKPVKLFLGFVAFVGISSNAFAGPMYLKALKLAVPDAATREAMIEVCVKDPDCYLVNGLPPNNSDVVVSTGTLIDAQRRISNRVATPYKR